MAALYNFPAGLTGQGQSIALIELNDMDKTGNPTGAGYQASDLAAYFKGLGIAAPTVVAVSVDGGANVPGPDAGLGRRSYAGYRGRRRRGAGRDHRGLLYAQHDRRFH